MKNVTDTRERRKRRINIERNSGILRDSVRKILIISQSEVQL